MHFFFFKRFLFFKDISIEQKIPPRAATSRDTEPNKVIKLLKKFASHLTVLNFYLNVISWIFLDSVFSFDTWKLFFYENVCDILCGQKKSNMNS